MLEVSFNELSTRESAASKAHAMSVFKDFMSNATKINSLKVAPLRIRMCIDLPNTSISEEFYTLKDWLRTLTNEERQQYLGFIVQDPIIVDNPAYYYNDDEAKGFGFAFNNDLAAMSYSTNGIWNSDRYNITRLKNQENSSDVEIDDVNVYHILIEESKVNHEKWLREIYSAKSNKALAALIDIDDFWAKKSLIFPWLDFGTEVLNQIKVFGSLKDQSLQKSINYLSRLNTHLDNVNRGTSNFDEIPGDVSNDGEATLNKYGEERKLPDHSGQIFQFSLHAKLGGDTRVYLKPRKGESRITIGYIGDHLKTVKHN